MATRLGGLDEEDGRMLQRLTEKYRELDEADDERAKQIPSAFADMLRVGRPLSAKQRVWVRAIYEKFFDEPMYENLASSGGLCRGREVETPAVLRRENLPMRPPKRRTDDAEKT
jgi:hypothetical protein